MRIPGILSVLVILFVSAGLVAGCSGDKKVDVESAESTIQDQYPAETGGLELTSISCEEGDAEVDSEFTCSGENDAGVSLQIEATVDEVDEDSGEVKFTWSTTGSVSDGTAFAETALTTLQNQGYAVAAIDCPDISIENGNEVECEATMDDGSSQTATITLTDDKGGFDVVTSGPGPG
jgi:hypothetical protein